MLEEPGDRLKFILITDIPSSLLDTVRSRSYKLRFTLLSKAEMEEFARSVGDDPGEPGTRDAIEFASGRPGAYLRYRHSEGYSEAINEIDEWIRGIINSKSAPDIEAMLDWKLRWRGKDTKPKVKGFMSMLAEIENKSNLPRGGDVFEIRKHYENPKNFKVNPVNWQVEGKGVKKKAPWNDSRKALLVAGVLRRILSNEPGGSNADSVMKIQDFIRKINWNCSFDIALERLYFHLAGN